MSNKQELTTVTMPKETYEHLLSLGIVSESLQQTEPKTKDEMFSCRSTNGFYANLGGGIYATPSGDGGFAKQYSCHSSKESAKQFEELRKQLAIQFEFNEVYTEKLGCNVGDKAFYPAFCTIRKKWAVARSLSTCEPRVLMYKEVCSEFCRLANLGLIDGLKNETI